MTEAFSDENLKRFIILTISHPPSQNVMSKWNTNNPQRGIPCTYCSETKRSCRSLATRLNCSSRSCSQNGAPCSRINEELFDRVKAAWPHVLRTDFDAALKEIRAEEPPKDTPRLLPSPEMDVRSMSTPSNGVGSADTPVTHVAALPGYSENAEETASPTSEALITGDPFANLPGGNTIPTNSERHGQSPQTKVSIPERGLSDPSTMVNVSSSILPRYSYYRPSCHVPSAIASYSPFAPLPSKSAAASKASANAAADLEQRILALIAERDAAVATNAENAEQMRLLEAAAAELQVVLDGKNELKSRMDVLQAENATLQLEKDTLCAERNALLESNNSFHAQYEELKEFERLHSIDEARSPDRDLRDLHQGTVDLESAVPFATLCQDLHALQRHAQALQAENDAATLNVSELEERFESESAQRNVLQMRTVDLEAKIKTIQADSACLLETIRGLQVGHELAGHRIDELESNNTRLSNSLRSQERALRDTRNQNRKYHQSIIFQHLAISKLRDGLASAYHTARDNIDPQSARICGVVSRHLVELKKLEIWLLERTPSTYDEIVKLWATNDYEVELEDEVVNFNDGASRVKKRQRGVD